MASSQATSRNNLQLAGSLVHFASTRPETGGCDTEIYERRSPILRIAHLFFALTRLGLGSSALITEVKR